MAGALTYRSTATVDIDNQIAESNENNNQVTLDFTVSQAPHLEPVNTIGALKRSN
ncbi:MAG: hypothetical protein JXK94_01570 [Deltaproteobacteria bacterium]|nr:hypothetical protein [Deltaproteobacteria bacterium]